MFIANNIYKGLLIFVIQRVFTASFPLQKPASQDDEQDGKSNGGRHKGQNHMKLHLVSRHT